MPQSRLSIFAVLAALSLVSIGAVSAQKATPTQKMGQFSLRGYARLTYQMNKTNWTFQADGPSGKPMVAKTTLGYELTAPHIDFVMRSTDPKFDPKVIRKVTELKATGGVKIVVQQTEQNSISTVTCDKAIYTSTLDPKDRGKVDLIGNVRSVSKDLTTNETVESVSERGTITVIDAETTRIDLIDGNIEAQINEPAPKPAKKNP